MGNSQIFVAHAIFHLSGKSYAFPERKLDTGERPEDIAILYSAPQSPLAEYSCITLSYSGQSIDLELFITNGTVLSGDKRVFLHHNIQSNEKLVTSFQTDVDIPFMVRRSEFRLLL